MEILALEHDGPNPAAASEELLRAEAARVHELQLAGVLRRVWFRADADAAVLLLEAPTLADAEAVVGTLPLVRTGVIELELIGLRPYPGLTRLFAHG